MIALVFVASAAFGLWCIFAPWTGYALKPHARVHKALLGQAKKAGKKYRARRAARRKRQLAEAKARAKRLLQGRGWNI